MSEPVVLRIVFHGASGAGKTTTARALGERLGRPVVTPSEDDGRTVMFDWIEYVGGRHDGRAIKTYLVTVPGHLADRSRILVETADAVIFVVDTTPEGLALAETSWQQLADWGIRDSEETGLVVQANKRDHDDAQPLGDVKARLGLNDETIIETAATDGDGVRQAFVYAVRAALTRVGTSSNHDSTELTPEALEALLQAADQAVAEADADAASSANAVLDDTAVEDAAPVATALNDAGEAEAPAPIEVAEEAEEAVHEAGPEAVSDADEGVADVTPLSTTPIAVAPPLHPDVYTEDVSPVAAEDDEDDQPEPELELPAVETELELPAGDVELELPADDADDAGEETPSLSTTPVAVAEPLSDSERTWLAPEAVAEPVADDEDDAEADADVAADDEVPTPGWTPQIVEAAETIDVPEPEAAAPVIEAASLEAASAEPAPELAWPRVELPRRDPFAAPDRVIEPIEPIQPIEPAAEEAAVDENVAGADEGAVSVDDAPEAEGAAEPEVIEYEALASEPILAEPVAHDVDPLAAPAPASWDQVADDEVFEPEDVAPEPPAAEVSEAPAPAPAAAFPNETEAPPTAERPAWPPWSTSASPAIPAEQSAPQQPGFLSSVDGAISGEAPVESKLPPPPPRPGSEPEAGTAPAPAEGAAEPRKKGFWSRLFGG